MLSERLRVGVEEGPEEQMFGIVLGLAATPERLYVVDYQAPAVRMFDMDGSYLSDIGGSGEGPGEFREPDSVGLAGDGRVFVREPRRGLIHVYSPEGVALTALKMDNSFFSPMPIVVTPEGVVYTIRLLDGSGTGRWTMGMGAHGVDGPVGEPIVPVIPDYEPSLLLSRRPDGSVRRTQAVPFTAQETWTMMPTTAIVSGTGAEYRFEVRAGDGTLVVTRDVAPTPVAPDEAAWHRRHTTAQFRRRHPEWVWDGADIPATKRFFEHLLVSSSGQIWVVREGAGRPVQPCTEEPEPGEPVEPCWDSEWMVDVFEGDGRFAGSLVLPRGMHRLRPTPVIVDDTLWGVVEDESGVLTVRGYRVTPEGG